MEESNAPNAPLWETRARTFVSHLSEGETADAYAAFDGTMKGAMPLDALAALWGQLEGQQGKFVKQGVVRREEAGVYTIVFVRAHFAKQDLDVKVTYNADGEVAGLFFVPAKAPQVWTAPTYVNPDAFTEREVALGEPPWVLPGTLSVPKGKGPFPAIVLVHGSGPQDRDETIGPNKPFKDLALGLASKGVVVLRYDKRTKVHGAAFAKDKTLTVHEETVVDVGYAATLLRGMPEVDPDKVVIVGHSLGATVMPRIAVRDAKLAGVVAMAPLARQLEDVIVEQFTYIFSADGQISAQEQKQLDAVTRARASIKALALSDVGNGKSILGAPAAYWLDLRGFQPHLAAKNITCPLLVLQGERDYQVTMDGDFVHWKKALSGSKTVTLKSYPGLTHLFTKGEGPSLPSEYETAQNVDAQVVEDIARWVHAL